MNYDQITSNIKEKTNSIKEYITDKYDANLFSNPVIKEIAYPLDENIIKGLKFVYIDKILKKPVEKMIAFNYGAIIANSIVVNEKNFPEINDSLKECCNFLKIEAPYTVIESHIGMDAKTLGTNEQCYVLLSNMLSQFLDSAQLKFTIAHECGHIAMGHLVFHTALQFGVSAGKYIPVVGSKVSEYGNYPFWAWQRCCDFTADRIGLLCCRDLKAAKTALIKTVGGFKNIEYIDVDNYVSNAEQILKKLNLGKIQEFKQPNPLIFKRIKALDLFYNSELYYSALKIFPPRNIRLLTAEELNIKTKNLISIF